MAQYERFRRFALWGLTAFLFGLLVVVWLPFFPALAFALIVTILTNGWYQRIRTRAERRFKPETSRTLASLTVILTLGFMFLVPMGAVVVTAGMQANNFVQSFEASAPPGVKAFSADYVLEKIDEKIGPIARDLGVEVNAKKWFDENRESFLDGARRTGSQVAKSFGFGALVLVIGFLTAFFLLRDGPQLLDPLARLLPLSRDKLLNLGQRVHDTTHAVLVGIVLVSIIQGSLAGIVYAVAGVPNALMWGVATIVVCMIPLLGGPIIYAPLGLILLSQGKIWQGALVLGVGFGLISQIDNILRPFFIGAKTNLHPMAIFFSLLGGVLLFGPLGLFVGPMLLTTVLTLLEYAAEEREAAEGLGEVA
ncbi:MAG: AI-2E family transporter [Fimbriimonadales bacterium]